MLRLSTIIWFLLLFATSSPTTVYECLPYPVVGVCIIEYVSYQPGDRITFPTGFQHFRFTRSRSTASFESNLTICDENFYEAMHRPSHLEITYVEMRQLVLPAELLLGNFGDNKLTSVTVSTGQNYQISYLDLKFNALTNIDFVESLVNLEMLHFENNQIEILPRLTRLTKLKYLYLQDNRFTWIPWRELPNSLLHLDCYLCRLQIADFVAIRLPSLEYLNLQHNKLTELDVQALLRAAPNLKEAHLHNNGIDASAMAVITDTLDAHNVSFLDPFWFGFCPADAGYEVVRGRCVKVRAEEDVPASTGKAVLLSAVVIGIAALFVYTVVLVFRHMSRQ